MTRKETEEYLVTLAKAFEGDARGGVDSELSQSPTLTRHGTAHG